jgi:hypothetical protein
VITNRSTQTPDCAVFAACANATYTSQRTENDVKNNVYLQNTFHMIVPVHNLCVALIDTMKGSIVTHQVFVKWCLLWKQSLIYSFTSILLSVALCVQLSSPIVWWTWQKCKHSCCNTQQKVLMKSCLDSRCWYLEMHDCTPKKSSLRLKSWEKNIHPVM